jgi:hypothetical protein
MLHVWQQGRECVDRAKCTIIQRGPKIINEKLETSQSMPLMTSQTLSATILCPSTLG